MEQKYRCTGLQKWDSLFIYALETLERSLTGLCWKRMRLCGSLLTPRSWLPKSSKVSASQMGVLAEQKATVGHDILARNVDLYVCKRSL